MRRTGPLRGCCVLLVAAGRARARAASKILRDCADDGVLRATTRLASCATRATNIPTDIDEYSDCRDVLSRALAVSRAGGGSSGGGSGGGGGAGGRRDRAAGPGGATGGRSEAPRRARRLTGRPPTRTARPLEQAADRRRAARRGRRPPASRRGATPARNDLPPDPARRCSP